MTTDIDIANRALAAINSRSTIANFAERSAEARNIALIYYPTRDQLLRAAHWDFARAQEALTLLKSAQGTPEYNGPQTQVWAPAYQPPPPWLYSYAYPSDCAKVRFIQPNLYAGVAGITPTSSIPIFSTPTADGSALFNQRRLRYQVATDTDANGNPAKVILCNSQQAMCVYTRIITNPDLWDDLFQEALVASLGVRLARPLTGNKDIVQELRANAMQAIQQARVSDGNEGVEKEDWTPDWMVVRGVGLDWSQTQAGINGWYTPSWLVP